MKLVVNGVQYDRYYVSDESEFEDIIFTNRSNIFGQDFLYYPVKKKFTSTSGIATLPDGFGLLLTNPPRWVIIESELESHPVFNHIVTQVTKFKVALENIGSLDKLVSIFDNEIQADIESQVKMESYLKKTDYYRFISDLIKNSQPILFLIIDQINDELRAASRNLPFQEIIVYEVKPYSNNTDLAIKVQTVDYTTRFNIAGRRLKGNRNKPISRRLRPSRLTTRKIPTLTSKEYHLPILRALIKKGGTASIHDVYEIVYDQMKGKLTSHDHSKTSSGKDIIWKNRIRFARKDLVKNGYMERTRIRGEWRISDKGRDHYRTESI